MRINEDRVIEDAQKVLDMLQYNSYSKNKIFNYDIGAINYLFAKISNKYFDFPQIFNPYHERLYLRSDMKGMYYYSVFVFLYMDYYTKLANNYLNILEKNIFTRTEKINSKVYSSSQIKEMLLDFFNEQGFDKCKIVKSMFDEERIEIKKMDLDGARAICSIMSSDIKPYIIVGADSNRVRLCDICDLAHELGHAIEAHLKLNRYNRTQDDRNKLLAEISSKFYEYEFAKYLQKNRIQLNATNSIINQYHAVIKDFCESLLFACSKEMIKDGEKYIEIEDAMNIDEEKDMIKAFRKEGEDESMYIFKFCFYKPLKYGLGSLAALNLSELKRQDPKEFDKLWNYFLSMRSLMNEHEIFDLFGLKVEDFIECTQIKDLIKTDISTYNKQLKRQL